jgi:serine beta-lactamase-like protein LACTB
MKLLSVLILLLGLISSPFAGAAGNTNAVSATEQISDRQKIEIILHSFMECIESRDSEKMYSFFLEEPVTWIAVNKEATQKERLKINPTALNYQRSDYKTWFQSVMKNGLKQEHFKNIDIVEDGYVASVSFDYSFWVNQKKGNWGKELWHLIKVGENWKIVSVIFSKELEAIKPEPQDTIGGHFNESEKIRAVTDDLLRVANLPGLSVAIRRKDEIVFAQGFGFADVEKRLPVTPQTQFRAASVSKAITATALAKMMQDKVIDIDAPIARYLPQFPQKKYPITARLLSGHIAGMPHYLVGDRTENRYYPSVQDALSVFAHHEQIAPSGTKYHYSSHGTVLLSAMMERASGLPYLSYVQQAVLNPFGMQYTEPEMLPYKAMPLMSRIYERSGNSNILVKKPREYNAFWASAGWATTPTDMVNMTRAFSNGYLKKETMQTMFTSQTLQSGETTQVGTGWRLSYDIAGRPVYEHAGVTQGARSVITYYPNEDLAISVMTNLEWVSSIEETAHMLAQAFLSKESKEIKTNNADANYDIKGQMQFGGQDTSFTGKLHINGERGKIQAAQYEWPIHHLHSNVYALVTHQGIYYLQIDINQQQEVNAKAIRYSSQLKESAINSNPFISFVSERRN